MKQKKEPPQCFNADSCTLPAWNKHYRKGARKATWDFCVHLFKKATLTKKLKNKIRGKRKDELKNCIYEEQRPCLSRKRNF